MNLLTLIKDLAHKVGHDVISCEECRGTGFMVGLTATGCRPICDVCDGSGYTIS